MARRCVLVSTLPSGSHILHFADGSTHEADVIIGADGIKSVVRDFVCGPTSLVYSNSFAYRACVPTEVLQDVKIDLLRPLNWVAKDKTFRSLILRKDEPDSSRSIGSKDIAGPWIQPASQDELLKEFSGFGDTVTRIIKEMKNPTKWYLHFLHPSLTTYIRQKVVLVGDAAHAMLPHLGSGVGQGLEDVYTICTLLGDPRCNKGNLETALKAYDDLRVARANAVQRMSTHMGNIVEKRGAGGETNAQIRDQVTGIWDPIWHYDLNEEVKRAVARVYGIRGVL
ncbi:hypothetical protein H0H93_005732 [Arthromyces matolae]|nr:hypothetical protein H0H93_005732 [Arthromyces matolae]